jgi:hypothetical protein
MSIISSSIYSHYLKFVGHNLKLRTVAMFAVVKMYNYLMQNVVYFHDVYVTAHF